MCTSKISFHNISKTSNSERAQQIRHWSAPINICDLESDQSKHEYYLLGLYSNSFCIFMYYPDAVWVRNETVNAFEQPDVLGKYLTDPNGTQNIVYCKVWRSTAFWLPEDEVVVSSTRSWDGSFIRCQKQQWGPKEMLARPAKTTIAADAFCFSFSLLPWTKHHWRLPFGELGRLRTVVVDEVNLICCCEKQIIIVLENMISSLPAKLIQYIATDSDYDRAARRGYGVALIAS